MFSAVVFDLDNTLLDRSAAFRAYLNNKVDDHDLVDAAIQKDDNGYTTREDFFAWFAPQIGEEPKTCQAEFLSTFPSFFKPNEDRLTLVRKVAESYPIACLTNGGSRTQRGKLTASGFDLVFGDHVYVSEEVGAWKPDRRVFDAVIEGSGFDPTKTIYIGDNFQHDIQGAMNAGWQACWVSLGRERHADDHFTIETIEGLWELL